MPTLGARTPNRLLQKLLSSRVDDIAFLLRIRRVASQQWPHISTKEGTHSAPLQTVQADLSKRLEAQTQTFSLFRYNVFFMYKV